MRNSTVAAPRGEPLSDVLDSPVTSAMSGHVGGPEVVSLVLVALVGLVAGTLSPLVIGRLPDREAEDDRRTYAELAGLRGLPIMLGIVTAGLWLVLAAVRWPAPDLPAYLWLAWVGTAAAYIDLRENRLPDILNLAAVLGVAGFLAIAAALDDRWSDYGRAWLAGSAAVGVFLVLALLRSSGLGLGDVKLVGSLGIALGWESWSTVVTGLFYGFVLAALVAVVLVISRRADRHTALPFGPALMLGTMVSVVLVSL